MYDFIYKENKLNDAEWDNVWRILCECDNDFLPPLSHRESSTQKELSCTTVGKKLPYSYFGDLKKQDFILGYHGSEVICFLSFRKNYICEQLEKFGKSSYITTVCVRNAYRKQGILKLMYHFLEGEVMQVHLTNKISTRTWSKNTAQIKVLEQFNYNQEAVIENHRGERLHTIYFTKNTSNVLDNKKVSV